MGAGMVALSGAASDPPLPCSAAGAAGFRRKAGLPCVSASPPPRA